MGDPHWTKYEWVNPLLLAVVKGNAYRVSKRISLADGEQLIIHLDPVEAGEQSTLNRRQFSLRAWRTWTYGRTQIRERTSLMI